VLYLILKVVFVILLLNWALGCRNTAVVQDQMTGGLYGVGYNLLALVFLAAALFVLFVM
jgi:hypothetical protein